MGMNKMFGLIIGDKKYNFNTGDSFGCGNCDLEQVCDKQVDFYTICEGFENVLGEGNFKEQKESIPALNIQNTPKIGVNLDESPFFHNVIQSERCKHIIGYYTVLDKTISLADMDTIAHRQEDNVSTNIWCFCPLCGERLNYDLISRIAESAK